MRRLVVTALALSATPLAAGACFPQFGEYLPEGAGASGGAGGSGGAPLAGCEGGFCVAPPLGWDGPVVLTTPGGTCGAGFDVELMAGETDHVGAPVTCGCECGPATGSVCPSATVTRFGQAECMGPAYPPIEVGGCTNVGGSPTSWTAVATPVGGSCPPTDLSQTPDATWNDRKLCGMGSPDACEVGTCAPVPAAGLEPRLCIYEDGDVACDAEQFPNKVILYTGGHVDDRRCDADCACGQPTGTACQGFVQAFNGAGCGASQDGVVFGMCDLDYLGSTGSLNILVTGVDQGACSPLARSPIGQITGVGPVTVCCTAAFE
jgi:hypothetical protein